MPPLPSLLPSLSASPLRPPSSPHPTVQTVMTFATLFRAQPMFSLRPTFLHKPTKSSLHPLLRGQVCPPLPPLLVSPSLPLCPSPLSPNTLLSTPTPKQHSKVTRFVFRASFLHNLYSPTKWFEKSEDFFFVLVFLHLLHLLMLIHLSGLFRFALDFLAHIVLCKSMLPAQQMVWPH